MEVTLLKLIISSGLHLVSKGTKESKKIWNQVNKDLFMNDDFLDYKDEHYVETDYRKIRDKYVSVKKEATKLMESGNKSKFAGDLSEKFKLISQIIKEESDADVERQSRKENDGEEKKLIQDTGERIMNGKVPKRDKGKLIVHLDGSTSDNRIPKRSNMFEEYIKNKIMKETTVDAPESSVEKQISKWINENEKTVFDLFEEVDLSLIPFPDFCEEIRASMQMVEALGLRAILKIYCQQEKTLTWILLYPD